jgi:hypothetical protein
MPDQDIDLTPGTGAFATEAEGNLAATALQDITGEAITSLSDVTAKAGTGTVVLFQGSPSITTPTIASFANSAHDHADAAGGGTLAAAAVPDGADATAIHDNVANEINAITLKGTPVSGDYLLIEDSAAAGVKKYCTVGSLPAGSEANDLATDGVTGIIDDQVVIGSGAGTAAYHTLPNGAVAYATATNTVSQAAAADLTDGIPNTRTVTAGAGMTGGGALSGDITLNVITPANGGLSISADSMELSIAALDTDTPVAADSVAFLDSSGGADNNCTITTLSTVIDHNTTNNYAADQHVASTAVETMTNKDLTSETNKLRNKYSVTIEDPADGDRIAIGMNERAITVLGVSHASAAGTSVLYNVEFGTTIASGTVVHTDTCATSTPEWDVTPSGDATIPTDQITMIEITTVTGVVTDFHVTVYYDED